MNYTEEDVAALLENAQTYMDGFDGKCELSVGPFMLRSMVEQLRDACAALSSIPRQNGQEWMPIAKAPANERGLVWVADQLMTNNPICFGGVRECRVDISFEKHRYAWAEGLNGDWNITHWCPLPAPPHPKEER